MPFRLPVIENFLFCFKLETGGIFLGYFCGFGALIGLLLSFILTGWAVVDFESLLNATITEEEHFTTLKNHQFVVYFVIFFAMAYCVVSLYACLTLIKGVKNRSSRQVKPFLILIGLETILAFSHILKFTWPATLNAIGGTIINVLIVTM